MSVFGAYSRYYDLLYRDKDYRGEVDYIVGLIERYRSGAKSLLELGCGSGRHAALLAERGYRLHGVDLSQSMLDEAEERRASLSEEIAARLSFSAGDIRRARVGERFDCVLSLFHVISYQPTNADLAAAFATVREHLTPGGIFLFDVWYGPAVLTDRPTVRTKRMQDKHVDVTRRAEPVWHPNECWVDVNFHISIADRVIGAVEEVHEMHRMRYLFFPEVESLAQNAGMRIVHSGEWMTGKPLGATTWGACFVLRK